MGYSVSHYVDKRAAYYGFLIYVLLVFILPFILLTIGKLVDHSFMHYYLVPYLKYKFILIILSGLFTGLIAKDHAFLNSFFVGLLGLLAWLILTSLSASMADRVIPLDTMSSQSIIRLSSCAAGGLCVSLFRYLLLRINKSSGLWTAPSIAWSSVDNKTPL